MNGDEGEWVEELSGTCTDSGEVVIRNLGVGYYNVGAIMRNQSAYGVAFSQHLRVGPGEEVAAGLEMRVGSMRWLTAHPPRALPGLRLRPVGGPAWLAGMGWARVRAWDGRSSVLVWPGDWEAIDAIGEVVLVGSVNTGGLVELRAPR